MYPICEASWTELYQSSVVAYPHTTRRQHVTQPISISQLEITPFIGVKTLFLKTLAINEGREYRPMILIKGVRYKDHLGPGIIEVTSTDGDSYWVRRPSLVDDNILIRCNCDDFYWRFNYYDHLDKSLYGNKRKKYKAKYNPGSANPLEMPGMCKHLMKMAQVLAQSGFLTT